MEHEKSYNRIFHRRYAFNSHSTRNAQWHIDHDASEPYMLCYSPMDASPLVSVGSTLYAMGTIFCAFSAAYGGVSFALALLIVAYVERRNRRNKRILFLIFLFVISRLTLVNAVVLSTNEPNVCLRMYLFARALPF